MYTSACEAAALVFRVTVLTGFRSTYSRYISRYRRNAHCMVESLRKKNNPQLMAPVGLSSGSINRVCHVLCGA